MDTTYATRAGVLCTTADYYRHFRATLLRARRSVLIGGWDFQPDLELVRKDRVRDEAPTSIREILRFIANRRPDLQIRVVSWNYSLVYEGTHQLLDEMAWAGTLPENARFALDGHDRLLGAHHHKIAVIDDQVAFMGGIDLSVRRWDRDARLPEDPQRVDPRGTPYDPIHDVQMIMDGDSAAYLGRLARARWKEASGETFQGPDPTNEDIWPHELKPDFENVEIDFARTWPRDDGGMTREIEEVYAELLTAARDSIYLENQYFTHAESLDRIGRRLKEEDGPEVIAVVPHEYREFMETETFGIEKDEAIVALRNKDEFDRLRVVTPRTMERGERKWVYVHSKLAIADDRTLIVGSANLSDRSMGLDTELVARIRGEDEKSRRGIRGIRERLLGLHLGMTGDSVRSALTQRSLKELVDMVADHPGRALVPTPADDAGDVEVVPSSFSDPRSPGDGRFFAGAVAAAGVVAAAIGIGYLVRERLSA